MYGREGSHDENGPERRQTRRSGPRYVRFLFFFVFLNIFIHSNNKIYDSDCGHNDNEPKQRQTCCLGLCVASYFLHTLF